MTDGDDRKIAWINGILVLILIALLTIGYFTETGAAGNVKEVRHRLGGKQVVERCVSCHEPARHRPVAGHDPMSEACTPCHNGMGRGTSAASAHLAALPPGAAGNAVPRESGSAAGTDPQALFSGAADSAGCLRCHPPQWLPSDSKAAVGWRIILDRGCLGCHRLGSIGGGKGPDLSRVGDYLGQATLASRIRSPHRSTMYSIMPEFRFSPQEIEALTVFLQGQSMLPLRPVGYRAALPVVEDPVARFSCPGCHKFRGKDGGVAPDLDLLYRQRSEQWLKDYLRDPAAQRPGARMPDVADEKALDALTKALLKAPADPARPTSQQERYELYCARCHGKSGDGIGPIAGNLAGTPRRFQENQGFLLLRGRERLLESVLQGIPGTAMAPFKDFFTKDETGALVDFALSKYGAVDPAQRLADIPAPPKQIPDLDAAKKTYARVCAECHGEGGDRSALIVHRRNPQPRNFRNRAYMKARTDEDLFRAIARGIPGTRMEAYRGAIAGSGVRTKAELTEAEVWQLAAYVRRFGNNGE